MGTKRQHENDSSNKESKKSAGFWALGLLAAMKDPNLLVDEDDKVVIIKDKYPKAEFHFLILPKEEISSLNKVNKNHIYLLQHMDEMGLKITKKYPDQEFRLGYHAVASMSRLHLHVISEDFNSPCLKTKKHWNSFTSDFFVPSKSIIAEVEKSGKVSQITSVQAKKLMDMPLKCHKCNFLPANMPKLKNHILIHCKK